MCRLSLLDRMSMFCFLNRAGAGKTTTFSMLTGEVAPSEGDAYIMGYSIRTQLGQVQQRVGFCPQVGHKIPFFVHCLHSFI